MKRLALILSIALLGAPCFGQTLSVSLPAIIIPPQQGTVWSSGNGTANGAGIVAISGGTNPYVCSLLSGSLPSGLSLSEVTPVSTPAGLCLLSGTPSVAGDFSPTIQVTDNLGATANITVPFLVFSSSLPSISNAAASSITTTSATITWTSSANANSQLCYGITYYTQCTAAQDGAGVTSHSVSLSNLQPGQGYFVRVINCGINGGAAQDYLCTSLDTASQGVFFTTSSAPSTGTLDYVIRGDGPNNVVQGYGVYIGIPNYLLAGSSTLSTLKFQVTNIPPNTKVHWPDTQDLGFASGTVSTTTTPDDTITFVSQVAVEFEILTNVGGTTPLGAYTLTITATTTGSGATPTHMFTWPLNVVSGTFSVGRPASQPAIPNLALWQNNMVAYGGYPATITSVQCLTSGGNPGSCVITANNQFLGGVSLTVSGLSSACGMNVNGNYGANGIVSLNSTSVTLYSGALAACGPSADSGTASGTWFLSQELNGTACPAGFQQCVQYYDGQNVYQRIQVYDKAHALTSNSASWATAANNSRSAYLSYVTPNSGAVPGYWVFPLGLYNDCTANINAGSCTALHQLASNSAESLTTAPYLAGFDALDIREACYLNEAQRKDYDAGGGTTLVFVKATASLCLGALDQIANNTAAWEQPFFDGIAAQAMIDYYQDPNTGNFSDVRVPAAIKALADHLWQTWWCPWTGNNGFFIYNSFETQHGTYLQDSNLENLNLLIAPMFAWLYLNTGQSQYQLEGDTIWNAGANDPPANGIGFSGKNFSQQYHWSDDYVRYRTLTAPLGLPVVSRLP